MLCKNKSPIFSLVNSESINVLKKYLTNSNDKIVSQALLCIGNIAAESTFFKKMILKEEIFNIVINISKNSYKPLCLLSNCLFLITNLSRGKPFPESSIVIIFQI
jgi:hypothetical protein